MIGSAALVAVLTGLAVGGGTFLLAAGPAQPSAAEQARTDDVRAAYRATDESRKMFGLLSTAALSATEGLHTATSAVPQIFDSVDTAEQGAEQLITGLDEASSLSAALDQVASVTSGLSAALNQVGSLQQLSTGARTGLIELRKQLLANPVPGSKEAVGRIDGALADTRGLSALNSVDGLRGTLAGLNSDLRSASARAQNSLASARDAAVQLRDGLAKLAGARSNVMKAITNMTTGAEQLKVALNAIDQQLEVAQDHLQPTMTAPTPAPDPGVARPVAWSLLAGGGGAIITFVVVTAAGTRLERRLTALAPASTSAAAMASVSAPSAAEAAIAAAAAIPPLTPNDVPAPAANDAPATAADSDGDGDGDGTAAAPPESAPPAGHARRNRLAQLPGHPSTETNPWLPVTISGTAN